MKFYGYIIYKLYAWGLKRNNDTPIFNVIVSLAAVHYFQLLTLYCIVLKFFDIVDIFSSNYSLYIGILSIPFLVLNYFLLYDKKRWALYVEKYQNESTEERRKGTIKVLSYLIGSILLFFVTAILLFAL